MPRMFPTDLRKQPTLPRETSCLPSGEKEEELSTAKATIGWCCWHLWHRCSTQCTMLQRHRAWCGWGDTRWRESGRTPSFNQSQLFRKEGDSIKITREAEGNNTNIKSLNLLDHSVQVNCGRANLEKTCLVATPRPQNWTLGDFLLCSRRNPKRKGEGQVSQVSQASGWGMEVAAVAVSNKGMRSLRITTTRRSRRGTWGGRRSSRGTTASSPWT